MAMAIVVKGGPVESIKKRRQKMPGECQGVRVPCTRVSTFG